jgi:predicted MFS family arabinose efflux permease
VLFCAALPRVAFLLFAGVIADRGDKVRLLVLAEIIMAGTWFVGAGLFLSGRASVLAMSLLAIIGGIATALFYPTHTGLVPQVVTDEQLQPTLALIRLASNFASIAGVALGGLLVASIGSGLALSINAFTYLVSAVLLAGVRVRRSLPREQTPSMINELVHGWREFTKRRWVWLIVVVFSVSNVGFSSGVGVVGPVVAVDNWGGARSWAFVMAAFSAGTVTGVVVAMRVRPSRPLLIALSGSAAIVLPVVGLIQPLPVPVVAMAAFLAGIAVDIFEILWQTSLAQNIPSDSLSRVSAYDYFGSLALTPLGLAAAGPIVEHFGTRTASIICAVLVSVELIALLDPQVRNLRAARPAVD